MNPITDIEGFLRQTINDSIAARQFHEFPWLEFKRQWYDLSGRRDDAPHQEFVKDTCALANTGYDSYLVFGVDESTASCVDAKFETSQVKTQAGLQEKIWSRTDPPIAPVIADFEHQGKWLSYVYIKPTRNRPHMTGEWIHVRSGKKFKNALFWREGARVLGPHNDPPEFPNRQVLTAMFLDRPGQSAQVAIRPWPEDPWLPWSQRKAGARTDPPPGWAESGDSRRAQPAKVGTRPDHGGLEGRAAGASASRSLGHLRHAMDGYP